MRDRHQHVVEVLMQISNDNTLRKRISANARNLIIEKYSIQAVLEKWNLLIKNLLENPKIQKKRFKAPARISLPPLHPLLKEDFIVPRPSLLVKIRTKLKIRTRIKSLFCWAGYPCQ